jgi:hypothetical protein
VRDFPVVGVVVYRGVILLRSLPFFTRYYSQWGTGAVFFLQLLEPYLPDNLTTATSAFFVGYFLNSMIVFFLRRREYDSLFAWLIWLAESIAG